MKSLNRINRFMIGGLALVVALVAVPTILRAGGTNSVASTKPVPYPLDTCVVSGDKLSGMGAPIVFVYSNKTVNQEIKFCCPDCKPEFLKHPDKYMKVIKAAEAKAKTESKKN